MFKLVFGKEFWAYRCMYKIAQVWTSAPDARLVICDVRFPEEVIAIQKAGGDIVRIVRTEFEIEEPEHESETALDNWDFNKTIVAASGDIESIHKQADQIMQGFLLNTR